MSLVSGDKFTLEQLNAAFASKSSNNVLGGTLELAHSSSATVSDVQGTLNSLLTSVSLVNNFYLSFKKITFTLNSSAQTTDLVSGEISYAASSALNVEGALVASPYNLCFLRRVNLGGWLADALGKRVIGRLSSITGGFRLTTRVRIGGSESDTSIGSAIQCELWFPVIFKGSTRPVYDELINAFSDNVVQEIPSATTVIRGLIDTGSQGFAGQKSFQDGAIVGTSLTSTGYQKQEQQAITLTGASALLIPSKSTVVLSGGLTSLGGCAANTDARILIVNGQAGSIVFNLNDTGQNAADRFGFTATIAQNESIEIVYITSISRWVKVG